MSMDKPIYANSLTKLCHQNIMIMISVNCDKYYRFHTGGIRRMQNRDEGIETIFAAYADMTEEKKAEIHPGNFCNNIRITIHE